MPLTNDKEDFKKYIKKTGIFMEYQVIEGEKISLVEKEKQEK